MAQNVRRTFFHVNITYLFCLPESMAGSVNSWNSMSMTTSIQMAQECLRQDPTLSGDSQDTGQSFEGLEAFAQTIESGQYHFTFYTSLYSVN